MNLLFHAAIGSKRLRRRKASKIDQMADEQKKTAATPQPIKPDDSRKTADDDVVGKAYDGRLMRRLVRYLAPYKLQVSVSAVAIVLKAGSDVLGPYFVKVAVDNYFAPTPESIRGSLRSSAADPVRGVTEIGVLYLASLGLIFGLEFVQTYMMQWTGQKIMFDLRSQIFRHIQQMHVGFFDRNPVGRLVTRLTSDVDALNDMFTSGVLAIFEDVFVLSFIVAIMVKMSWLLALLTLSVIPLIFMPQIYFAGMCARAIGDSAPQRRRSIRSRRNMCRE